MRASPPSPLRRAAAALALAGALVLLGGVPAGAVEAAPGRQVPSTDPLTDPLATDPLTDPLTTDPLADPADPAPDPTADLPGEGADDVAPAVTEVDAEAVRERADADLRAVWEVVAALAVVAVGLLVLLVLYVRATQPARAARRREARRARAAAPRGEEVEGDTDTDPVAAEPGDEGEDEEDEAPADDGVVEDEPVPEEEPVPVGAGAAGEADPDGEREEVPAGDVTVRAARPPAPPDSPAGSDAPAVVPPPARPAPARRPARPRRVQAPAKKLATPDAERVLVRPGQAPIRVPAVAPPVADPASGGPEAANGEEGDAAPARTDGRPPAAPSPSGTADGR